MFGLIKDGARWVHDRYLRVRSMRLPDFRPGKPVLILAPHPDDETLGCGGLIKRLCAAGMPPHVVLLTGGEGSLCGHSAIGAEEVARARRQLARESARILGLPMECLHFLDFGDGHIGERRPTEMRELQTIISDLCPATILVPHSGEGWPDHLDTRRIGIDLAPAGCEVWEYCVWMRYYNVWRLDWRHAAAIRLTPAEHAAKLAAAAAYVGPLSPCGVPWSGLLPRLFVKGCTGPSELFFHSHH